MPWGAVKSLRGIGWSNCQCSTLTTKWTISLFPFRGIRLGRLFAIWKGILGLFIQLNIALFYKITAYKAEIFNLWFSLGLGLIYGLQANNKYRIIRKEAPVTAVTIVNLQAKRQPSSSKWRSGFMRKDGLIKFFLRNQICFDGSGGTSKWSLRIREIIAIAAAPAKKTHTNTVECSQRLHIFSHEYLVIASR